MITAWELYWVMKLDLIREVGLGCFIVGGILMVLWLGCKAGLVEGELDIPTSTMRSLKRWAIGLIVMGSLLKFVPTTKEYAALVLIPKIVNSELVQEKLSDESKELYSILKQGLIKYVNTEVERKEK